MTPSVLAALLSRELRTLQREIEAYPSDTQIWATHPGLPNTGGTLALHAAGNLQHFIGAVLGGTGYVRDRAAEFSRRDVPRAELLRELETAVEVVERVLPDLPPALLGTWYPEPVAKRRVRTDEFLVHLEAHLAYHVGQVDYHRRAVTGENLGVGAVAPGELPGAVPLGD
jgi:hypothetical protein